MQNIKFFYLDTSCAIKLFSPNYQEIGSANLKDYLKNYKNYNLISSDLLSLEIYSALRSLFRANGVNQKQLDNLHRNWDLYEMELIDLKPITNIIIGKAKDIILNSSVEGRVRSLDCIHFATFLNYEIIYPNMTIISSDKSMCELAKEYKKNYFNPLENI